MRAKTVHVFSHEGILYAVTESLDFGRWLESEFGEKERMMGQGLAGLRHTLNILVDRLEDEG